MSDSTNNTGTADFSDYFPMSSSFAESPSKSKFPAKRSSSSLPVTRRSSTHRKESSEHIHCDVELGGDLEALLGSDYSHGFDFDSDDDNDSWIREPLVRKKQEVPNRYVSQEELKALKGCVTRRRALFSPSPSSSSLTSSISLRKSSQHSAQYSPGHSYSLPLNRKRLVVEGDAMHTRQGSLEYDHLTDFNPQSSSLSNVGDSISVQFRFQGEGETVKPTFQGVQAACNHSSFKYKVPFSCSIPEIHHFDQRHCVGGGAVAGLGRSNSSNIPLVDPHLVELGCERCSDAAVSILPANSYWTSKVSSGPSKQDAVCDSYFCPSTRAVQHHSPYHTKFNSPLLSRHQCTLDEGTHDLKAGEHTGSNFSLYSQTTTTSSLNDRRPHCSYSKGVDGSVFKDRTDMVVKWFLEFSDQQRNMMLMSLLEHCDCAQMHFLSVRMEPVLHDGCPHNCQDLLSWLPFDVISHIFSFLDPVGLCRASLVNKDWYHAAIQPKLWKKFCKLEEWKTSISGELKYLARFTACDGSVNWKGMFGEKYRLRRNWLKGYFNVRTFEGHIQGISCIQFDDTRIVSGSWDKTIKVWNRRTNTVWAALTLAGHSGTVRCLHLHNNRLVSGSSDRTIKVWDLATDKVGWVGAACRATMVGHMHTVRCLQADDEKVISGSYDQTLKVWDIKTGQCQQTLRGHTDAVLCLQFDQEKVVSGSKDKTIKIWSLPDGVCKLTIQGHQAAVSCLHFDETRIISGALDRLIKIWDMVTGKCIRCIDWIKSEGHTGVVRQLQADSWKIISAADDKTLKVWNVHTGNRLLTLKSHTDGVTCLQFNGEVIVSGSYDKTVKLWDFSVC